MTQLVDQLLAVRARLDEVLATAQALEAAPAPQSVPEPTPDQTPPAPVPEPMRDQTPSAPVPPLPTPPALFTGGWGHGPRSGLPWWSGAHTTDLKPAPQALPLAKARGRDLDLLLLFPARETWAELDDQGRNGHVPLYAGCRRPERVVFKMRLFPFNEGPSPRREPGLWREIATGTGRGPMIRQHWQKAVASMAAHLPEDAILCPAWEMTGDYPWSVNGAQSERGRLAHRGHALALRRPQARHAQMPHRLEPVAEGAPPGVGDGLVVGRRRHRRHGAGLLRPVPAAPDASRLGPAAERDLPGRALGARILARPRPRSATSPCACRSGMPGASPATRIAARTTRSSS